MEYFTVYTFTIHNFDAFRGSSLDATKQKSLHLLINLSNKLYFVTVINNANTLMDLRKIRISMVKYVDYYAV
jgi:hypothetical protein